MRTCRKPIATALLLLYYHLLTWQTVGAVTGRDNANVSQAEGSPGEIILEKVIISGNEKNTSVVAKAVARDPSEFGDEALSFLSSGQTRVRRHSNLDQHASESRTVVVNIEDKLDDNEEELERIKRVVAKYEPQRIVSRKAKRKIDVADGTHDFAGGETADTTAHLERTYHKVPGNTPGRKVSSQLAVGHVDVTSRPPAYLSRLNSKRITVPEASGRTEDPRTDVNSSAHSKKKKKLLKNYAPANRTVASPRLSPKALPLYGQSEVDETVIADDADESTVTPGGYLSASKGWLTRPRNESSPDINLDTTKGEEWSTGDSSSRLVLPFISRSASGDNYHADSFDDSGERPLNLSADSSTPFRSPFTERGRVPSPFAVSRPSDRDAAATDADIETPYKKLKLGPTDIKQRVVHSSGNVLPTNPFHPSTARRYIPIKRGKAAAILGEAHPPANPLAGGGIAAEEASPDHATAVHANAKTAPVVGAYNNYHNSLSRYNAVTGNPAELTLAKTNFAIPTYAPVQTSASYILQRQKVAPRPLRNKESLPALVPAYSSSPESDLSANPGIVLYNKFANLYSIPNTEVSSALHAPRAIVRAPALPYVTLRPVPLKSISSALPKAEPPIVTAAPPPPPSPPPPPPRQSGLFVSQDAGLRKESEVDEDSEESVETNIERSRVEEPADEPERGVEDYRSNSGSYKGQLDHEDYEERSKATPSKRREKEDRERDRYQKPRRDYEDRDKHYAERHDEKDERDEEDEKFVANVRNEEEREDENEKDADETHECEYAKTNEGKKVKKEDEEDSRDGRRNESEYDREDPVEQREKPRYAFGKYDKEGDPHEEYYSGPDFTYQFASEYYDHGPRSTDRYERKGSERGNRYAKSQQERRREEREDDDPAEDESVVQRSRDQRARGRSDKYGRERDDDHDDDDDDGSGDEREYHRRRASPHRDSPRRERPRIPHEEYRSSPRVRDSRDDDRVEHIDESKDDNSEADAEHGETRQHAHKHEEHHEEKKKHGGDGKFEEGESAEHEEEHHEQDGKEGHKGYKAWHEHEKVDKGHRDKEHSSKEYDEKDGEEKKHDEEGGYHEEHHHGEKGEKSAEFGEKGEHKKGHNTKGEHLVHKKDEYEKKTEFFDEFHEDGGVQKHGEHHHEHESEKGGHEKKAHHDAADHKGEHGSGKKYEKGGHHHEHEGHKSEEGHDHHHSHGEKYGKKEAKEEERSFKHGGKE